MRARNIFEFVVSLNEIALKLIRRFVDGNNVVVRAVIERHQKPNVGKSLAVNLTEQRQIFIEPVIENDDQTNFRESECSAANFKVEYD